MAKKKAAAKTEPVDPAKLMKAAEEAGHVARQNREPFRDCPYGPDDPARTAWEKGWNDEIAHEASPRVLHNELRICGVTTSIGDLELLSFAQRAQLVDWRDCGEADPFDQDEFNARCPSFVTFTGKSTKADEDHPEYLMIVAFDGGPAETGAENCANNPESPALAPLQEIPPANTEEVDLRALMLQFDQVGVAIDETEWRTKLDDQQQRDSARWVKYRLTGTLSPVPYCLMPWASATLKAEYSTYAESQEQARQVRLAVRFDKPSVVAPGEDDEGKIKVCAKATFDVLPGGLADRLFRYKRCKIQFATRKPDDFDQQELVDENPIYSAVSDVSGYKASRHETSFAFMVDQEVLDVQTAFKHLWGFAGTVVVEVLGAAAGKKAAESSSPAASELAPKAKPIAGQKALPGTDEDDDEEEDVEYLIAEAGDLSVKALVKKEQDGWYVDIDADTPDGWECENDDIPDTMSPRVSPVQALEARIGQIVDHWQQWKENEDADQIIRQLRFWLVELAQGKEPATIQDEAAAKRGELV